jgi:hypothetical protein
VPLFQSGYQLQEAYNNLAADRQMILDYLKSKGVKSEEIVFSTVDIQKQYAQVTDANGSYRQENLLATTLPSLFL